MTLSQRKAERFTSELRKRIALLLTLQMIISDVKVNFGDDDADKMASYFEELYPGIFT